MQLVVIQYCTFNGGLVNTFAPEVACVLQNELLPSFAVFNTIRQHKDIACQSQGNGAYAGHARRHGLRRLNIPRNEQNGIHIHRITMEAESLRRGQRQIQRLLTLVDTVVEFDGILPQLL